VSLGPRGDSLAELLEHRRTWDRKPVLARVYSIWFELLLEGLPRGARVLEVGAGPGFLLAHARRQRPDLRFTSLDIAPAPWNSLVGDAQSLPLRDASLDAVVGLDVLHHLARPALFFAEAARVLPASGRAAFVEPWLTPMSYPIYRWLHQEGVRADLDPWQPFEPGPGKRPFEGDGGLVTRLVRNTPARAWRALGWRAPTVRRLNAFAYLLTLGFKGPSLLPAPLAAPLLAADRALAPLAGLLGLRALVALEREAPDDLAYNPAVPGPWPTAP